MTVDNFAHVLPFAPSTDDGDSFIYTELLDRTKRVGIASLHTEVYGAEARTYAGVIEPVVFQQH